MVTLAARDRNDIETTAGSEFYDVFGMPDGRLAATIGDVMGAGVAAGAVMAQIKVSLRGAALTSSDPNVIFTALDEFVSHLDRTWQALQGHDPDSVEVDRAGFGGEMFVTALLAVFDPATRALPLPRAPPPGAAVCPGPGGGGRTDPAPTPRPNPPLCPPAPQRRPRGP